MHYNSLKQCDIFSLCKIMYIIKITVYIESIFGSNELDLLNISIQSLI